MPFTETSLVPINFRGTILYLPDNFTHKVGVLTTENIDEMTAFQVFMEDMQYLELLQKYFPGSVSDTAFRIIVSDSIQNDCLIEDGMLDYLNDSSEDNGKKLPLLKRIINRVGPWIFQDQATAVRLLGKS